MNVILKFSLSLFSSCASDMNNSVQPNELPQDGFNGSQHVSWKTLKVSGMRVLDNGYIYLVIWLEILGVLVGDTRCIGWWYLIFTWR